MALRNDFLRLYPTLQACYLVVFQPIKTEFLMKRKIILCTSKWRQSRSSVLRRVHATTTRFVHRSVGWSVGHTLLFLSLLFVSVILSNFKVFLVI